MYEDGSGVGEEELEYVRADVEFEIEYSRCVDEAEDDET